MTFELTRRHFLGATLATAALSVPAMAQDKPVLKFSAVFSEQDIRAQMTKMFAEAIAGSYKLEPYYGGNLFKQGTELVAIQRGNLQMGNIAPQDVSNQIPEWSVLTSAYLFRDAQHVTKFFRSEAGAEFKKMADEKLGVYILGPTYFGARQIGLKPNKKITTPADMAGIKLRMPGGDAWQFLGAALGANPTPMAYAEVYTGLQTGAIDGQDNPLPNVKNMKFYEVMSQIVMTSHLIGYDLLTISSKIWKGMSADQQKSFQAAADKAMKWSEDQHLAQEKTLVDEFKKAGLNIYEPDIAAFRKFAQEKYLASDLAKSWPKGVLEKVAAI
ncbi:TRAP transporter substrate-binding protein DctP [Neorhizobium galegae]|uniref:TRAP transporter substrate-binding protein DctP n=1 Tax=Neorhizobium galegae TaxID=399 RepID=UPI000621AE5E|nr:TRAP transporter substrate-binding protein DctP [Neorhizobium galegae]MCQ1767848.1 TRAP transporter substrate-binding protein DctP [Neorhizobium galegae]MCQ1848187.1 TRAP transporter substrate-binding protein DctP [Neorhizobium galegae]CDZ26879.1 Sialic acid-binding periplasmic protein SiaP [Neorhizobium galegae bv. officinalis]CDZ37002.1 Sialic acid-binding periplasmic protein SiaP [Neorhizobium galegae bv. officinalis]